MPGGLVGLVCLVLRQVVSQLVDARLVQSLERLKHKRRLRLPLLLRRIEFGGDSVSLLRIGLAALLVELFRLVLGLLEVLGHAAKVLGDCVHVLHVGPLLEGAERLLDVSLDALGKLMVRLGNAFDGADEPCPGCMEDTKQQVSMTWSGKATTKGQLRSGHTHPMSACALGTRNWASLRRFNTYCSSTRRRSCINCANSG